MRAFPLATPGAVRLTVDEGALVIGLLDFLVEPDMRPSPDVIALAERTRLRVSSAMAAAISDGHADLDARFDRLREDFYDLQVAYRAQSQTVEDSTAATSEMRALVQSARTLMGEAGGVEIDATDDRLRLLRAELARMAA